MNIENVQVQDEIETGEADVNPQEEQDAKDKAAFGSALALILKKYEMNVKSCMPVLMAPVQREINQLLIDMREIGIIPKNSETGLPVYKIKVRTFRGKVALIPV